MQRRKFSYKFILHGILSFLFLVVAANGVAYGQVDEKEKKAYDEMYDSSRLKKMVDSVRSAAPASPVVVEEEEYGEESTVEDVEANKRYFLDRDTSTIFASNFEQRKLPDSLTKSYSQDEAFWYANEVFEKKKIQPNENRSRSRPGRNSDVVETVLWILIIALFIGIIIVFLQGNKVWLFRSQSRKISQLEEEAELSDDIFAIPFQRELEKAVAAGNYRLAVRLHFLQLLRKLADKKYIQYEVDKTNFDYLMDLHASSLYQGFFKLTRAYEFAWYGKFDVDREKYERIKEEFQVFEKDIR